MQIVSLTLILWQTFMLGKELEQPMSRRKFLINAGKGALTMLLGGSIMEQGISRVKDLPIDEAINLEFQIDMMEKAAEAGNGTVIQSENILSSEEYLDLINRKKSVNQKLSRDLSSMELGLISIPVGYLTLWGGIGYLIIQGLKYYKARQK